MHNLRWSESERKLARIAFEATRLAELGETMSVFKAKAASAKTPDEMWSIVDDLVRQRREIDEKYDYRYSQLLVVFGRLVREGRIELAQLKGLSAEKLSYIKRVASL